MKIPSGIPNSKLILLVLFIAFLSSCVTQKQVKYLQRTQKLDTTSTFANKRLSDYKIQSNDNLYIKVVSLDDKSYKFFNKQGGNTNTSYDYANDAAIYLNSYSVDDSGYIAFPVIGKLHVKDLTLEQAKTMIQAMIDEYVKETIIILKMVNFNITVVGKSGGRVRLRSTRIRSTSLKSFPWQATLPILLTVRKLP